MNRAETQIAELYVGLIGRAPDRSGLDFWVQGYIDRLSNDESEDTALAGVAQAMFDADATTAYYPVGLSDREVVAQFYENVLGRTGDRNGVDFWTAALKQPDRQTGEVLVDMIQAVKRYDGTDEAALTSQALFNNKAAVAGHYVEEVSGPDADADIDGATALLDAVGPQTETSNPADIEDFVTEHYQGPLADPPVSDADAPTLDLSPVTDLESSNAYYSYTEVATFTATDAEDGDLSAYADEVIFTPGSNSLGYYELYYGDVLLTKTGADAVTAGEALPAVELTAIDSDGNQVTRMVQPKYGDDYPVDGVNTNAVIGDGDTIDGDLERAGDQDWFRIDMRADREYELELSGNFEELVRVVDEGGDEVASEAVGESGWQADLTFSPSASGTYYVVADSREGDGAGDYSLSANERVLPTMEETEYVGSDHDTYPYQAVTFIEATFPNGETYTGSGAVVGQNDVLTASHVIYSVNDGGLAESITIYPGRDGSESPYGGYSSEFANYYEVDLDGDGMFSERDSEDDLAVLGLGSALGDQTGWFGLDPNATSGNYNLTGYPGLYRTGYEPRMTNDYGRVTESENAWVFNYDTIESNPGNSGGPLWYEEDNGDPYLVGVASTSGWATDIAARYGDLTDAIEGNDDLFEGTMTADARSADDQADGVGDISLVGLESGAGIDGLESAA